MARYHTPWATFTLSRFPSTGAQVAPPIYHDGLARLTIHSASTAFSTNTLNIPPYPPLAAYHAPDLRRPTDRRHTSTAAGVCSSPIPTTQHFKVQTYRHSPLGLLIRPGIPPSLAISCAQHCCYIMIYSSSPPCASPCDYHFVVFLYFYRGSIPGLLYPWTVSYFRLLATSNI